MLSELDPALIKGRRWTSLLESMRLEGVYSITLDYYRDIYTILSTACRMNSEPDRDRRYSVQSDKTVPSVTITVTKRVPDACGE